VSEIKDGGPAFPDPGRAQSAKQREVLTNTGMTLRDFFAAHAVAGVLQMVATGQHELGIVRPTGAAGIAASAYEIADAMIASRPA
jgi:hypothetical protein